MFTTLLKRSFLTAGLLSALSLAATPNAQAADLDFGLSFEGPNASVYVGNSYPRYSHYDRYHKKYGHYGKSYKSYKDDYRYSNDYDGDYRYRYGRADYENCAGITAMPRVNYSRYCKSPREIYDRLRWEGWHEFRGLRLRPRALRVFARSSDGSSYKLRVDRCTGDIIRAKRKLAPYYRAGRHYY